ncbi:hypothetical protein JJT62_13365 [Methylocystis sp. Sn-Cys]|nr:hypothetical protein [Methylocystis sp. Sn-Cys]
MHEDGGGEQSAASKVHCAQSPKAVTAAVLREVYPRSNPEALPFEAVAIPFDELQIGRANCIAREHFEFTGFGAFGVGTARTWRLWISPRRAIDAASSSIETPACMRRTFDCDKTSLSNGISREEESVIFWAAFATVVTPRRAEALSLAQFLVSAPSAAL